jgi:L-threonylcarbamoyladenylate synthase
MKNEILKAATLLKQGDVVAIPTETVYGLAANAFDKNAIRKIFKIKQRPLFNPLIVHIKSIDDLEKIATNIPPKAEKLAKHFWPGALTLVLQKNDCIPDIVTAGKNTVGIRVPSHPIALALLEELNFPLAAPSANPFGYISPTCATHVQNQLGNKVSFILDGGNCNMGIESTIIGFDNGEPILYRVGAISKETIEKCIGRISIKTNAAVTPDAPGMLSKHYSPKTKFMVSKDINSDIKKYMSQNVAFLLFSNSEICLTKKFIALSNQKNMEEAARNLYAAMHKLDSMKFDLIIAEKFPNHEIGVSLNDRLYRAQETEFDTNTLNQIKSIPK